MMTSHECQCATDCSDWQQQQQLNPELDIIGRECNPPLHTNEKKTFMLTVPRKFDQLEWCLSLSLIVSSISCIFKIHERLYLSIHGSFHAVDGLMWNVLRCLATFKQYCLIWDDLNHHWHPNHKQICSLAKFQYFSNKCDMFWIHNISQINRYIFMQTFLYNKLSNWPANTKCNCVIFEIYFITHAWSQLLWALWGNYKELANIIVVNSPY